MLDLESRQIRVKVVPNVKRETLQNEILNLVEKGSTIYTYSWPAYEPHEGICSWQRAHSGNRELLEPLEAWTRGTYVAVDPIILIATLQSRYFGLTIALPKTIR